MKDLLRTYIENFDEALGGGIPKGSVVLVTGEPGTMKTSLTYSVLHHCASNEKLNALYITLEQKKETLEHQMESMGFSSEEIFGRLSIMDITNYRKKILLTGDKLWLDYLKRCVERRKEVGRVDVLAIDSLDALEALSDFSDRRIIIYQLFEWLRDCDFTTFIISEAIPELVFEGNEIVSQKNDAEYLADAVIALRMKPLNDFEIQRRIRCIKMRGQNHDTSHFALMFESGKFRVAKAMSG